MGKISELKIEREPKMSERTNMKHVNCLINYKSKKNVKDKFQQKKVLSFFKIDVFLYAKYLSMLVPYNVEIIPSVYINFG